MTCTSQYHFALDKWMKNISIKSCLLKIMYIAFPVHKVFNIEHLILRRNMNVSDQKLLSPTKTNVIQHSFILYSNRIYFTSAELVAMILPKACSQFAFSCIFNLWLGSLIIQKRLQQAGIERKRVGFVYANDNSCKIFLSRSQQSSIPVESSKMLWPNLVQFMNSPALQYT